MIGCSDIILVGAGKCAVIEGAMRAGLAVVIVADEDTGTPEPLDPPGLVSLLRKEVVELIQVLKAEYLDDYHFLDMPELIHPVNVSHAHLKGRRPYPVNIWHRARDALPWGDIPHIIKMNDKQI